MSKSSYKIYILDPEDIFPPIVAIKKDIINNPEWEFYTFRWGIEESFVMIYAESDEHANAAIKSLFSDILIGFKETNFPQAYKLED